MNKHGLALGMLLLLIPINGLSAIVDVPNDHPTIQGAIDAAIDGDTILIADGPYTWKNRCP